jgi:mono/diheme cytochrome c family protein
LKRAWKILRWLLGSLVVIAGALVSYVLLTWNSPIQRSAPALMARHDSAAVARGEYLYKVTWQCGDCHTPENGDPDGPPSGGRLFDLRTTGPGFGLFYSKNITPDTSTGIGSWTDGELVQAIREGVNKSRHVLFPIMPVDWMKNLSDEDALALAAYLRSLPPVRHEIKAPEPSLFAKALFAFGVLSPGPQISSPIVAPPPGPTAEYGRYFATAAAGCADCHTPRNLQNGQFYLDSLFAGGSLLFGEPEGDPSSAYARNIRPHETDGIGKWTEEQFVRAVTSGVRPDSTVLDTHMPYAQYRYLAPDDLRAVYLFLRSLSPLPRTTPPAQYSKAVMEASGAARGQLLFEARCQACHGMTGMRTQITSVKLAEAIPLYEDVDLRNIIYEGQPDLKMPGFHKTLSSEQLDDIIAHLRSWRRQ